MYWGILRKIIEQSCIVTQSFIYTVEIFHILPNFTSILDISRPLIYFFCLRSSHRIKIIKDYFIEIVINIAITTNMMKKKTK